jgi:hypothetical protein
MQSLPMQSLPMQSLPMQSLLELGSLVAARSAGRWSGRQRRLARRSGCAAANVVVRGIESWPAAAAAVISARPARRSESVSGQAGSGAREVRMSRVTLAMQVPVILEEISHLVERTLAQSRATLGRDFQGFSKTAASC